MRGTILQRRAEALTEGRIDAIHRVLMKATGHLEKQKSIPAFLEAAEHCPLDSPGFGKASILFKEIERIRCRVDSNPDWKEIPVEKAFGGMAAMRRP